MDNKNKLILWILIDLVLLIAVLILVYNWYQDLNTLKNPCAVCEKERPEISECFYYARVNSPPLNLTLLYPQSDIKD